MKQQLLSESVWHEQKLNFLLPWMFLFCLSVWVEFGVGLCLDEGERNWNA